MATWNQLTREQKIRLLMEQDGLDRAQAERQIAILDGRLDPQDVVGGLPPAQPLGVN
jgi:hypothetical protein